MKRIVFGTEIFPFYEVDPEYDASHEAEIGFGVDLTEEEWADHDRALKESKAWQAKLEDLYNASRKAWWDGLSEAEKDESRLAWARNLEESRVHR